jgi:hypothetical protein
MHKFYAAALKIGNTASIIHIGWAKLSKEL